jgi:NADH:ubiquinone oxidoreductase subunit C
MSISNRLSFSKNLICCVPRYIYSISSFNQNTVMCSPVDLLKISIFLFYHHNCSYKMFIDLFGTDYLFKRKRFLLIYNLFSSLYCNRLFLKFFIEDGESVMSITKIYPCAEWYEREVWDMFGVYFIYNSDLRRILTDYGFVGHPLRKDFPLTGFVSLRYDDKIRAIIYDDVRFVQEYRYFNIVMPWDYFSFISSFTNVKSDQIKSVS